MHVACNWRPHGYNLHALVASTVQSRQFFESMLPEQKFEFKNEETILKKLRTYANYVLARAYPATLCMARSNLVRQLL
jgi:hypothetical protein